MVNIEVLNRESLKMVKITLDNDAVRCESGAMYYTVGDVNMEAKMPGIGGFLKAAITKEKAIKPMYRGTGQVYLEPSYGEFTVFEMDGEDWIFDKGAFYAAEMGVEVGMAVNKSLAGLFGGEGLVQTKVSGRGKVVLKSSGPIETIELNNSKLVVDGSFALARTGNLDFKIAKASKGLFSTALSGEGFVNTFTGTGKVLISPVPNRYMQIMNQFESINARLAAIEHDVDEMEDKTGTQENTDDNED